MNASATTNRDRLRFWVLTVGLLLVLVACVLHALFSADGDSWIASVPFWKVWEISSIAVTLVITLVFWITYVVGKEHAGLHGSSVLSTAVAPLMFLIFAGAFTAAGIFAACELNVIAQVGFLALGVLCAVGIGLWTMRATNESLEAYSETLRNSSDEDERIETARLVSERLGDRDNIAKFLCFSDAPIAFAMILLGLFVAFYKWKVPHNEIELRAFIAGAVALQLLYSNVVYWIEAFADTPKGRQWLDRRGRAFQAIKRMLLREERPDGTTEVQWAESKLNELFPPAATGARMEPKPATSLQQNDAGEDSISIPTDGEE